MESPTPAVSNWLLFFSDAATGTNKAKNSRHVGGSCWELNSAVFGPAGSTRQSQIPTGMGGGRSASYSAHYRICKEKLKSGGQSTRLKSLMVNYLWFQLFVARWLKFSQNMWNPSFTYQSYGNNKRKDVRILQFGITEWKKKINYSYKTLYQERLAQLEHFTFALCNKRKYRFQIHILQSNFISKRSKQKTRGFPTTHTICSTCT